MAIVHPRALSVELEQSTFVLDQGTTIALHNKGVSGTASQVREPMWRADFVTAPLENVKMEAFLSWLDTQRGGLNTFLSYDKKVWQPLAYPDGVPEILASTWNGTATVVSLSTPGVIEVSGVPIGFKQLPGDRVGLIQSGRYGYFRVSEEATANGSGALSVSVEPLVQSFFTTAATARFYRAEARFRIVPGSISYTGAAGPQRVTFSAGQVL